MFKTYCYSVYGISLWCSYRVTSFAKVKIAHNDIFRPLLNVKRSESASSLFLSNHTNNLDVICRNSMYNLMERLIGSNNTIIEALCNSDVRIHSKIWKRWAVALGVEWESILMFWVFKISIMFIWFILKMLLFILICLAFYLWNM